jgi:hypothetical protein
MTHRTQEWINLTGTLISIVNDGAGDDCITFSDFADADSAGRIRGYPSGPAYPQATRRTA